MIILDISALKINIEQGILIYERIRIEDLRREILLRKWVFIVLPKVSLFGTCSKFNSHPRLILFSFLLFLLFLFTHIGLFAQQESGNQLSLPACFSLLQDKFEVDIFYQEDEIPAKMVDVHFQGKSLTTILDEILANTSLSYLNYRDYAWIIAPRNKLQRSYDLQYFEEKAHQQPLPSFKEEKVELFLVGNQDQLVQGQMATIRGFVSDDATEEPLTGATLMVQNSEIGVITNEIGQYELSLPVGTYIINMQSTGYLEKQIRLEIISSGELDLNMSKEALNLDEIVISAETENANVSDNDIGLESLSVTEIKRLPSFLGEADVIKSLMLLPGVSSVGEGSGGINVRGGTVDQNLIMQDGLYIFNSSHVLGLFSLFNPDIVSKVNLYKGNMPARFGGRLSSVLDVELKEGNYQKFSGKGGLGLVSSRLTLESPIKKGSSSVIAGGRISLSDYLFDVVNIAEINESAAFFTDANIKFTQRINNKGKFILGGYHSQDRFKFTDQFDFRWRSRGVNSRFTYLISNRFSVNFEGVISQYTSQWDEPQSNRAFHLENGISYFKGRAELNFQPNDIHTLNIGSEGNHYIVHPGSIQPITTTSVTQALEVPVEQGREIALYLQDDIKLGARLALALGVRYAIYHNVGPGEVSIYTVDLPRRVRTIEGTESYQKGEIIDASGGLEPRASLRFSLDESASIKMSYSRSQQFLNQLSNTTAVSPVDVWQLSNRYIKPLRAHNYAMGYFKNFSGNIWESSFELFYRDIDHLIEYKDLADLLVNPHLETEILSAIGRSYGLELSLNKKKGRLTGWLGYTLSRTERKTNSDFLEESINNNDWFLSNFDRPHDLSMVITLQANQRSHLAVNFVYSSGRPVTAPSGSFSIENLLNIPVYSDRNQFRIPAYHRLDISYTVGRSHKKRQAWGSSWTYSIYNVYARRNPYSVFFTQNAFQNPRANRLSVLGTIIPSITYNFSF